MAHARADLLCYRVSGPDGLVAAQAAHWDPVIAWAKDALQAPLTLAEGIVHVAQADAAMAAIRRRLEGFDAFGLAALHVMTALTGSALLALAVALKRLTPDEAWARPMWTRTGRPANGARTPKPRTAARRAGPISMPRRGSEV